MKPLRKLAKGYQYMRDDDGNSWVVFLALPSTTPTTAFVWSYGEAPPECFADPRRPLSEVSPPADREACAKPAEEPRVEERTLRSPDGSFVKKVWLKDDPPCIEAQIVQQPEEWRNTFPRARRPLVDGQADRLETVSHEYPQIYRGSYLCLRGNKKGRDLDFLSLTYDSAADRDAYLAKLEATVAAMPRLADQFKKDDRVVVAASVLPEGHSAEDRAGIVGQHGRIMTQEIIDVAAGVRLDDGRETSIWLINLRHERADERPAEKKPEPPASPRGDARRARGEPPRKYINDQAVENVCGKHRYIVRSAEWNTTVCRWMYELCPDGDYPTMHLWENEIRPCSTPPRKFADGQWFRDDRGNVDRVNRHEWKTPINAWAVYGETGSWWYEKDLMPCPPPLSDAQRMLNPGDKVRVRKERWDAQGKPILPSIVHPPLLSAGTILRSWGEGMGADYRVKCAVRFGMGADVAEYLHNLDPAESE